MNNTNDKALKNMIGDFFCLKGINSIKENDEKQFRAFFYQKDGNEVRMMLEMENGNGNYEQGYDCPCSVSGIDKKKTFTADDVEKVIEFVSGAGYSKYKFDYKSIERQENRMTEKEITETDIEEARNFCEGKGLNFYNLCRKACKQKDAKDMYADVKTVLDYCYFKEMSEKEFSKDFSWMVNQSDFIEYVIGSRFDDDGYEYEDREVLESVIAGICNEYGWTNEKFAANYKNHNKDMNKER